MATTFQAVHELPVGSITVGQTYLVALNSDNTLSLVPADGATVAWANHEADADYARPDAAFVIWTGTIDPNNALATDMVITTV